MIFKVISHLNFCFSDFRWNNIKITKFNESKFFQLIGFNSTQELIEEETERCFAIEFSKRNFTIRKKLVANGCNNGAYNYICKFGMKSYRTKILWNFFFKVYKKL